MCLCVNNETRVYPIKLIPCARIIIFLIDVVSLNDFLKQNNFFFRNFPKNQNRRIAGGTRCQYREKWEKCSCSRTGSRSSYNVGILYIIYIPVKIIRPFVCSYLECLMHLFKGNVGSGVFAMGDAFKNGGIWIATVITLYLGLVCVHCQHILVTYFYHQHIGRLINFLIFVIYS